MKANSTAITNSSVVAMRVIVVAVILDHIEIIQ